MFTISVENGLNQGHTPVCMSTILIIDDDSDCRDALKARLEIAGHKVLEATNGEEGLALMRSERPALIFLDIMMPKMDGWKMCRILKEDTQTAEIPVVMLTARDQQIEELRSWESGANAYVAKPWEFKQIQEILKKFLPRSPGAA